MDFVVIVPARFASSRFPGKPLMRLASPGGVERPLIEWTWRAAIAAAGPAPVVVATDDARIAEVVTGFGGRAVMTAPELGNGTERCAAALGELGYEPSIVVNFQGDSPLLPAWSIAPLVAALKEGQADIATPYLTCDAALSGMIMAEHAAGRVGGTCVVTRADGTAAYFSKLPIPHGAGAGLPLKLHLGLYAYTSEALRAYAALEPSRLELAEGLEQLRFVEAGLPIAMVEIAMPEGGIWEVNNPEDTAPVAALLR